MQQTVSEVDRRLAALAATSDGWARLKLADKIAMLEDVGHTVHASAQEWVALAAGAKGLRPGSPLAGEEWISGPWAVLYAINRYLRTLRGLASAREVPLPAMRPRPDGRTVIDVFPYDAYDRVLLNGVHAHVWMRPGLTPDDVRATCARLYRNDSRDGRVALILGAGNIASIAPLDVLYKLIADGAVCMLKMNPVNEYLGPTLERALAPLVSANVLRFAYGGADVGEYLCTHPIVDEIHVTGSERTYDAIVASVGSHKPVTAELGNVSPTIVVPGPWSASDLQFQAEHIATQKAHNAGFNCIASQVLILPQRWSHTSRLRHLTANVFAGMEQRPEYYPGAQSRRTEVAGDASALRTMVALDPADTAHAAFTSEVFSGALGTVALDGSIEDYLRSAVAFANDVLHGTLGANIIVHPRTMREHRQLIDEAIAALRYGCIGVNVWTGVGYFITETPWGAYPGHTRSNIGSGIGVVHNSYLLEGTEKSVVYAPFRQFPKPAWFVTNRAAAQVGQALCDFEAARAPINALRVAALALMG